MTSKRPYWCTKLIKKAGCGTEVFSLVKKVLLFQETCIAADHVSENDPNVKRI